MRLSQFSERFQKDVRELAAALGKLEDEGVQGRIARNNARGAVRRVLERIRYRMDAAYPVIRKPIFSVKYPETTGEIRQAERKSRHVLGKAQRAAKQAVKLKRQGWGEVLNKDLVVGLAEAGVRVRRLVDGRLFAPKWAVYALIDRPLSSKTFNVKKAEECRRSLRARKAVLAARALGGITSQAGDGVGHMEHGV